MQDARQRQHPKHRDCKHPQSQHKRLHLPLLLLALALVLGHRREGVKSETDTQTQTAAAATTAKRRHKTKHTSAHAHSLTPLHPTHTLCVSFSVLPLPQQQVKGDFFLFDPQSVNGSRKEQQEHVALRSQAQRKACVCARFW